MLSTLEKLPQSESTYALPRGSHQDSDTVTDDLQKQLDLKSPYAMWESKSATLQVDDGADVHNRAKEVSEARLYDLV